MRTARFWAVAQRVVVIAYRRFGPTYRSHLQRSRIDSWPFFRFFTLGDWTDRLSRNVCKEIPLLAALQPRKAQFWTTNTYISAVLQKWQKSELSFAFWVFHRGVIDSPIFWDVTLSVVKLKSIAPKGQSVLLGVKPLLGRPPVKACAPRLTDCAVFNAQRKMEL
jgi:hypothetical protein